MNDGRGVVLGVDPGRKGLPNCRFAQVAFSVALPHTFIHGLVEIASRDVDLLPYLQEDYGEATVLAQRHLLSGGNVSIFEYLIQDLACYRGLLFLTRFPQGSEHILSEEVIGFLAQPRNGAGDIFRFDFFHPCIVIIS